MASTIFNSGKIKLNTSIVLSVFYCLSTLLYISVLLYAGVATTKAIVDVLISNTMLFAFCAFIISNMRYYLPKKEKYLYVLVISSALSAIWFLIIKLILKYIYRDDDAYLQFLQQSSFIRFLFAFLMMACNTLVGLLWYTQKEQQEDSERKADMEKLARDAELNKLRQQLQPHFLFNSLNSISALTGQQPEKARHMIQQLSDFLRNTLRNEEQQWVSLQEELTYLELYLDIEKVRFGHRLQSSTNCDEETLQMKLPSMLLQPLVENAIKFGLYDTLEEVAIIISAKNNNGVLEISIQNPYDESTAVPLKGNGFGLAYIQRRLFLLFGRNDLLQVKREAQQFIVILSVPQLASSILSKEEI